jgi:hypothetical protein
MKAGLFMFLVIYLSIYGGMHVYIYRKMMPLIPSGRWLVIIVFCLLVAAPLLLVRFPGNWLKSLALPLGWVTYLWMGFAVILFFLFIIFDGCLFMVKIAEKLGGFDVSRIIFQSSTHSALFVILLAVLISIYGVCAARRIPVESVTVPTKKVSALSPSLRIVQISDVHLGLLTREAWVDDLVRTIDDLKPDIIVSTGDLVDMQVDHIGRFADRLHGLKPRLGKFAVRGNHEVYAGMYRDDSFFERAGFRLLSNEGVNIGNGIAVVGIDDPAVSRRLNVRSPDEKSVLDQFYRADLVIFLKHQPVVEESSIPFFDIQLSGHSHGGQIFPFNIVTGLVYPAALGLSKVGRETWFYHNRGTGTWGPPMRVLAPPEVTVIDVGSSVFNDDGLSGNNSFYTFKGECS